MLVVCTNTNLYCHATFTSSASCDVVMNYSTCVAHFSNILFLFKKSSRTIFFTFDEFLLTFLSSRRSSTRSFIHPSTHPLSFHLTINSSFVNPPIHSSIHSPIIHSPIHQFIHSSINSPTYPSTLPPDNLSECLQQTTIDF